MLGRVGIARLRRLSRKLADVVRPFCLGTVTPLSDALDSIPDLSATIGTDRPFERSLVIINKQA